MKDLSAVPFQGWLACCFENGLAGIWFCGCWRLPRLSK
jgi:hypothetical protein